MTLIPSSQQEAPVCIDNVILVYLFSIFQTNETKSNCDGMVSTTQ